MLQSTGSRAHRLQESQLPGSRARAQLLQGTWDLPGLGIKPVSSVLAGGFFTTEPPGEALVSGSDVTGLGVTWASRFLALNLLLGGSVCRRGEELVPRGPMGSCLKTQLVRRRLLRFWSFVSCQPCDQGHVQGAGFLVGKTVE